ncbi:hypothetical protein H2199_005921 [Coniosporium tulheliwenetii]|uniref:Uncharacterized protein n=1 Tax=Coniosporium tulheliwenetii TaxID=3383036 RepID=A0ACC2YYA3_9PEZI|nr:hypothetical protein H2199_005921 [Cladosporium sp. JES 115]
MPAATMQPFDPKPEASLSSNDAHVLSALFDPEASLSRDGVDISASQNSLPGISETELPGLQTIESAAIRPLNTPSPSRETVEKAVEALGDLIATHPSYASAYTNRAQAIRLLLGDDLFSSANNTLLGLLLSDLSHAITLTSPASPQDSLSRLQAHVLATAHTHRGYILLKAAKGARDGTLEGGPEELRRASSDELEEMASRDFFQGGRYGDKTAQQIAVRLNPYAKMCGAIVKEAMRKEMDEYRSGLEL